MSTKLNMPSTKAEPAPQEAPPVSAKKVNKMFPDFKNQDKYEGLRPADWSVEVMEGDILYCHNSTSQEKFKGTRSEFSKMLRG